MLYFSCMLNKIKEHASVIIIVSLLLVLVIFQGIQMFKLEDTQVSDKNVEIVKEKIVEAVETSKSSQRKSENDEETNQEVSESENITATDAETKTN